MNRIKNSPARRYSLARNSLLFVIILTVLNCVFYLMDSDSYYLCSIILAYWLIEPEFIWILLPVLIVAAYVVAYILSKRKGVWLIVAAVMFALDTLIVLFLLFLFLDDAHSMAILGLDLVAHIVVVVLLFLGVKARKVALMSDDELLRANSAAGAAAAALEGDQGAQGQMPEISCTVSVSDNGKPSPFANQGFVRFEPNEVVVGAQGTAARVLIGSLLASMKEAARFSYGSISSMTFTNKRQTALRLDLIDGRILCFVFPGREPTERFLSLMQRQGVAVPQRAE